MVILTLYRSNPISALALPGTKRIQFHVCWFLPPLLNLTDCDLVPSSIKDDNVIGIENGNLIVASTELKEVFDAVIRMIFLLIISQMEKVEEAPGNLSVSAILLVGGFGSSEYLRKEMQKHFGEDINVIQPVDA